MATVRQKICKFIFNKGRITRVYLILKKILVRGSLAKLWAVKDVEHLENGC